MKLYVNGDSHAAAAEAVNPYAFAEDDGRYFYLGRAPHPDNAAVGWPTTLGKIIKAVVHNDSESASSNSRILRTTRSWLAANQRWWPETVVVIGWSTWERQEWLIDYTWYQINASGIDHVPDSYQERYREFVSTVDWQDCTQKQHSEIWQFHQELENNNIKHIFFNGNNHFGSIPHEDQHEWNNCYIKPYEPNSTYDQWLKSHGYRTVSSDSWHFGADAHAAWARVVLYYGIDHQFWR
jgi:hypothetical protein